MRGCLKRKSRWLGRSSNPGRKAYGEKSRNSDNTSNGEGTMRNLPLKLAVTGGVAAFLVALPVSLDLSRSNATAPGHASTISVGLKCDTAQAVVGRPGTPGSVAGVARRSSRRAVRRHY